MKQLLLLALGLFTAAVASAQITVSGTVSDCAEGQPLIGVTVFEEGTTNGTFSDENGSFSLVVSSATANVVLRFVGFETSTVSANEINGSVCLNEDVSNLDEVVITALGTERSVRELPYSLQKIESRDVSEVKAPNFVDNLAGRVAGVTVSQGATGVGSTSKITIRGEASFTNNNPLFVVDGTPINNNTILNFTNEAAAGFQEVDFGNGAMEVNADDVESITVLKGPSAAALYGTRASNGVIIVTTKKGSASKGLGVSLNSTTYVESAFQLPEFQNNYGQGNSGQFEFVDGLGGGTNDNITYSWGPELNTGLSIAQFDSPVTLSNGSVVRGGDVAVHGGAAITPTAFNAQPNNLKDFYRTGYTTINNIAIGNATNTASYRVSFTDLRSESIIPGTNLNRKTGAANLVFTPTKKLEVTASLNYINSQSDNRPANGYGSENVNYSLVAWGPRSLNTESLQDYWQPGLEDVQQFSFNYTFFDNPYFILLENRNALNRDRVFSNLRARYNISSNLSLAVRTGMDYSNELRTFRRAFSSNRFASGAYAEHTVFFRENNTDVLLNYKKAFDNFTVDVSAGANRMDQHASTVQSQALALAQPGVYRLTNAAVPLEVFQFSARKRINSVYAFAKIGWKGQLYAELTGRNDWSSALATPTSAENAGFFYPSASASWIASKTLALPEWINFAALRASWAQVGNDTDPYQTAGVFVAQTPYNNLPTYSEQSLLANANLLPERSTSTEVGANLHFFKSRVRLDVTYYNALNKNQILSLPVAISSGYNQRVVNGGAVRSKGLEAVLGITPVKTNNLVWESLFNFNRNVAVVESLPEDAGTLTLAYSRVYDNVNQTVWFQVSEGDRMGNMYGTGYLKDDEGRFILDDNGNFIANNELQLLGNYNPDFILGWSNYVRYKNWDFSVLVDWRQGGILVSRTLSLAGVGGQLIETENRPEGGIVADGVVNTGTAENPVYETNTTAISAESYYRQYYDRNHEENNVYNASYLKIRQLAIGYTFKKEAATSGLLGNNRTLQLSLVGRNLFAFSQIPHFDPEQLAVQGNTFVSGVEDMSYATTRSIGLKLNYNF